jgi:NitT/TauT family transport system substrate-binding protein
MTRHTVAILALTATLFGAGSAFAQGPERLTIGLPGIPPVFVGVQAYVAQDLKLFEKYGVQVDIRPFDSGAAAARAAAGGDIAIAISPTPLVAVMISNTNVELVSFYGYPKPDWLLGAMDPNLKCEDVKGKPVGVDSAGGARSIALNQMLRKCGLTANDTQQVGLSSNVGPAMIAGQIPFGVLHIDDVPLIEREAKKKVSVLIDLNDVTPVNHYLVAVTRRDRLPQTRGAIVKALAAMIEAERFMRNPANADRVARIAAPTGRGPDDAKLALAEYLKIGFWPAGDSGVSQKNFDAVVAVQQRVGAIKEGTTPVTFQRFFDHSLFEEALKLAGSK